VSWWSEPNIPEEGYHRLLSLYLSWNYVPLSHFDSISNLLQGTLYLGMKQGGHDLCHPWVGLEEGTGVPIPGSSLGQLQHREMLAAEHLCLRNRNILPGLHAEVEGQGIWQSP
jgi:hypothetical protein